MLQDVLIDMVLHESYLGLQKVGKFPGNFGSFLEILKNDWEFGKFYRIFGKFPEMFHPFATLILFEVSKTSFIS